MRCSRWVTRVIVLLALGAAGCGGGDKPRDHRSALLEQLASGDEGEGLPPAAPEEASDEPQEASWSEPDEPAVSEEPDATPTSGPARVTVKALLDDEELPITVRVLRMPGGDLVQQVRSGTLVRLEPGTYALEGSIDDEALLVDRPTKRSEPFTVGPGEERTEELAFGRARVQLRVLRGNRRIRKGKVELRRAGSDEVVVTLPISERYVPISPGRYDATVHFGRQKIDVSGLTFQAGAEQVVPIRVR